MGEKFFKDVFEFQKKYPTQEEREKALQKMSSDEIMQLSRSCGTVQGACYYARFAQQAAIREKNLYGEDS